MIIGISAGQGQGKSTLIDLACKHDKVEKLNLQTSREILAEWGYTLDEVNRYLPLKKQFQEECLRKHTRALNEAYGTGFGYPTHDDDTVLLVERTFSDIYAYTVLGMGAFNEYSEWLEDYGRRCAEAQKTYFSKVVFLSGRDYSPEDDGVRSINREFSDVANYLIQRYTDQFSDVIHIDVPDLDLREEMMGDIINVVRRDEAA